MRFAVETVRRVREACGPDFILIYRLSLLDLVEDGNAWDEIVAGARAVEAAGATIINSGIGWHEARVPTIATSVPRGAFAGITARLKPHVSLPLVAVNRINMPEVAEDILAAGQADMVSLARPLLADPEWPNKARAGKAHAINTCIACNKASAWTMCSRTSSPAAWSIRAPATRPNCSTGPPPAGSGSPWLARARPAWPAPQSPPGAAMR